MSDLMRKIFALQPHVTTCTVRFPTPDGGLSSQTYIYRILREWGVKPGDWLVVNPRRNEYLGVCVEKVHRRSKVSDKPEYLHYKWALGKLDLEDYERRGAEDETLVEAVQDRLSEAEFQELWKGVEALPNGASILKLVEGN